MIRTFLFRLCRNRALADDLAQDTFLRAHQKWEQASGGSQKAWLFKIAYRIFLDHVRKDKRRRGLTEAAPPPGEIDPPLVRPVGMQMDIERAMDSLPDSQRACVMLCLAYGFSHSEASAALNLPLGTVKSHVARGKSVLKTFLTAYQEA